MSGTGAWHPIQVPDPDNAIVSAQQQSTQLPDGGVQTSTQIQYKNGSTVTDTDVVHEKSTRGVTTTTTDSTKHIQAKDSPVTIDSSSHTVLEEYEYSHTWNWTTTLTPADGPPTTVQGQSILDPESGTNTETVTTTYPGGATKQDTTVWSDDVGGENNAAQHTNEYDEHGNLTDSSDQQVRMARDGGWEPKPNTPASSDGDTADGGTHETDDGDDDEGSTGGDPTDDSGSYGPKGEVTPGDIDSDGAGSASGDGDSDGSSDGDSDGSTDGSASSDGDSDGSTDGSASSDDDGPGDIDNPFEHAE